MATKRRQPGTGSLYKRADGMWVGAIDIVTSDGTRRRKTVSSRNKNKAIEKLRELRKQIDSGRVPTAPSTTVAKWLDYWLLHIVKPNVGPATYKHYEQSARLHVKPSIGTKRIDRLTIHDVRKMIADVQDAGSTRAAQKAHGTLRTALKAAEADGIVGRNVAAAVPPPDHETEERDPFPIAVVQHIIATAIATCDPMWASRWAAAFVTGGRPAELRGLRWQYVDLADDDEVEADAGSLNLEWQLRRIPRIHGCGDPPICGYKQVGRCPQFRWDVRPGFVLQPCHADHAFTRPKTKAGKRIVPLIAPMATMLKQLRKYDEGRPNPHDLVWHDGLGRPFTNDDELEQWAKLMRAAKLTTRDDDGNEVVPAVPYAARHSTATLLLKAGVPESTRMKIIGHSSVAAQRIYAHEDQELARAAMDNLTGLIELPAADAD